MSSSTWTPRAVSSESDRWRGIVWRVVEAQHTAATMKLVDSAAEQDLLEALLDGGKPAWPEDTLDLDYLLATPFRYPPRAGGSRFRAEADPGVFYGAGSVRTACAELGYWRWRFLRDAPELGRVEPVAHTAFRTQLDTRAVDLRATPFDRDDTIWRHPSDYGPCQHFARQCRQSALGAIVYASVRDPLPGWCIAVLEPAAFARPRPLAGNQTWWLAVTPDEATWRRRQQSLVVDMRRWRDDMEGSR
ncbi:MAG: RES family NAD+ phosphorylase [Rhodocyclaceae bacterium]|nr:RES family NAD+ phosphorylase [Rhodocyclaceae bacterium]